MRKLALLFDLDGTLIDSIDLLVESMQHAFDGATRAPSRDEWVAGIGTPLRQQLASWADDDAMVEFLLTRYREYQDLHLERRTSAYDGVVAMLEWARSMGHSLGIVTSKGRGMTDRSLKCAGLEHFFDTIVTVEATTRHKPHADPVLFALEQLRMPNSSALFAGDSPHDIHAGRTAAVLTVACEWGPFSHAQLAAASPHCWAPNVPTLRRIIEEQQYSNHGELPTVQFSNSRPNHVRTGSDVSST